MNLHEELLQISENLSELSNLRIDQRFEGPLQMLTHGVDSLKKSFSGSWLGYHSRVYYKDFISIPPGAHFSQEWGLMDAFGDLGSNGNWVEYDADTIQGKLDELAQQPNLSFARETSQKARELFDKMRHEVLSILTAALENSDAYLETLKKEIEELRIPSKSETLESLSPGGQIMTRDTTALGQRTQAPVHAKAQAEIIFLHNSMAQITVLAQYAQKAGSHLARKDRQKRRNTMVGTNVFIGHGRSLLWKNLKDFISDRLHLPFDEFNRVPVAGITNIARLSEMLESAAIAFIVLTAEDETVDGKLQARMNVIHEVGLFQGRLGFTKAIILLEEGCEEFSNIQGLGQIRFPKGNISSAFEEIRRVLEREGLIKA